MGINEDIDSIMGGHQISEIIERLGKLKGKIKYLTVVYCLEETEEETYIMISADTSIAMANLMLDEGKQAILHGTVVDDD